MSLQTSITRYELVSLLGCRATQLSNGAKPLVEIGNLHDPLEIAQKEYEQGVIPISIIRSLPNGKQIQLNILPRQRAKQTK